MGGLPDRRKLGHLGLRRFAPVLFDCLVEFPGSARRLQIVEFVGGATPVEQYHMIGFEPSGLAMPDASPVISLVN